MKKAISITLALALALTALTACGSSSSSSGSTAESIKEEVEEAVEQAKEEAEVGAAAEEAGIELKGTISVAASPTPHAEILEAARESLRDLGWDLEIIEFEDYVQPNLVVESGEIDCNYFQHIPYLDEFNAEQGTHIVNAGGIHYEPFGIYPGTKASLDEVAEGDAVAIPNDTTNEARALLLLADNGLLTLADGVGLTATVNDITDNPYNLEFVELEAAQVARVVDEVAYVVLNGNYALEAGYSVGHDSIAYESSDSVAAETYVNIIACYEGHENDEKITDLVSVLKSDEIRDFIESTYDGAVVFYEN